MNEEELLDEVFDETPKWKNKYKIFWCDLCKTFSISCPEPNCHGCEKCIEDEKDFNKAKSRIEDYLNEEEKKVAEKMWWLKKYMKESLARGEYEINWKWMKENGHLCKLTEEIFKKEVPVDSKEYDEILQRLDKKFQPKIDMCRDSERITEEDLNLRIT